jgi:hypothetical protein
MGVTLQILEEKPNTHLYGHHIVLCNANSELLCFLPKEKKRA